MSTLTLPTSGLADFVMKLANRHKVRGERTSEDDLADVITRLSGDTVAPDNVEDMIVALKRARVIDGATMVSLLGNYLDEKKNHVRSVQRF